MANPNIALKTVVGLFDDLGEARAAVHDLTSQGFARDDISLLANASAAEYSRYFDSEGRYRDPVVTTVDDRADNTGIGTGASVGAVLGGLGGLLLGLMLLPTPGLGPVVVAGPITTTLVGAMGGAVAGGIIGALIHVGVPDLHAPIYAEGVRRGGSLVMVKAGAREAEQAMTILGNHRPVDLEQRASAWRERGWERYDPASPPYTAAEIAKERGRH